MADHTFSFQATYSFPGYFNQDFQDTSELLIPTGAKSPVSFLPPAQPVETFHSRKEKQRRQALDRVLKKLTVEDLPDREYAVSYLQHKFRRNCKGCTLASSGTAVGSSSLC